MPLPALLPTIAIEAAPRPTNAAIARRSRRPSSGSSASSVRAVVGPDAGDAAQQILVHAPDRDSAESQCRSPPSTSLHPPFEPPDVIAQVARNRAPSPAPVRADCRSAPSMSSNCRRRATRAAEPLGRGIGDRARRRLHARAKEGQQLRIDRIRLRRPAERLRKRADLAGIHHDDRQRRGGTLRHQRRFIAARRLHDDHRRPVRHVAASRAPRARSASSRSSTSRRWGITAMCSVALLTSIPIATGSMLCAPGRRGSRPYACPGSWPHQLSGMIDDGYGRAPRLICGLETWSFTGYSSSPSFYQIRKT